MATIMDPNKGIKIKKGDRVCITKLMSFNSGKVKDNEKYIGLLKNDITTDHSNGVEAQHAGDDTLTITRPRKIFPSYTCIVVHTDNSMYLIEKL